MHYTTAVKATPSGPRRPGLDSRGHSGCGVGGCCCLVGLASFALVAFGGVLWLLLFVRFVIGVCGVVRVLRVGVFVGRAGVFRCVCVRGGRRVRGRVIGWALRGRGWFRPPAPHTGMRSFSVRGAGGAAGGRPPPFVWPRGPKKHIHPSPPSMVHILRPDLHFPHIPIFLRSPNPLFCPYT